MYYSYASISLEKHSKLTKFLDILPLPTKQRHKDLKKVWGGPEESYVLDELDNSKPITKTDPKNVEEFAGSLDVGVKNLKEVKRTKELGNGTLYHKLQRKKIDKIVRYKTVVFMSKGEVKI